MTAHLRRQARQPFDGESLPSRRAHRLGATLASCVAASLVAAGMVFVAAPGASAQGIDEPPLETVMTATPAVLQISPLGLHLLDLTATLAWVQPIPGETIVFKAGGTTLCTATTNYLGVASCSVLTNLTGVLAVVTTGGYTATFAGDDGVLSNFAPSSAKAGLIG